jgi:hypothetical protein
MPIAKLLETITLQRVEISRLPVAKEDWSQAGG